jgi:GTPase
MAAEFCIAQCYNIGGVSICICGTVESGEVIEGSIGRTFRGKKFTLVKIEKEGFQLPRAKEKEIVNLFVKYISKEDIRPGEVIYFD